MLTQVFITNLYTSGFNTINQIYKTTFIFSCIAVISILLAKIHMNTHSELLHKLASHTSQIPSFFQLLYFLDVAISSVNIRFNFHTGILVGLFSIGYTGHLLDITPYTQHKITPLSPLTYSSQLYATYIHHCSAHLFYGSLCPSLLHHLILSYCFSCTYCYHLSKRLDHTIRTRIQL